MPKNCLNEETSEKILKKVATKICSTPGINTVIELIENKVKYSVPKLKRARTQKEYNERQENKKVAKFDARSFIEIVEDMISSKSVTYLENWEIKFLAVSDDAVKVLKNVKEKCKSLV